MFVRDFIHVDQPFEVVAPRFVSDTSWLAPIAEEAAVVARDVAHTLALPDPATAGTGSTADLGGCRNGHTHNGDGDATGNGARSHPGWVGAVRCEVGPVRARAQSIFVPMWLIDVTGTAVLPDLNGDLEVAPVGSDRSVISLGATYRRAGPGREAALRIERATEAGVRTFLSGIAGYLGRPLSTV